MPATYGENMVKNDLFYKSALRCETFFSVKKGKKSGDIRDCLNAILINLLIFIGRRDNQHLSTRAVHVQNLESHGSHVKCRRLLGMRPACR
jgi:hypothetical protein